MPFHRLDHAASSLRRRKTTVLLVSDTARYHNIVHQLLRGTLEGFVVSVAFVKRIEIPIRQKEFNPSTYFQIDGLKGNQQTLLAAFTMAFSGSLNISS